MPATEQTWRDSKLMHVVFGVSSLAMLWTTIWMLAADHRREWKDYQRKFQAIEAWTTRSRISQLENQKFETDLREAHEGLAAARREVPDGNLLDAFEDTVREHARNEAKRAKKPVGEPDFASVDAAYKALGSAPPEDKAKLNEQFQSALKSYLTAAKFREDVLLSDKKFRAADLEVARSQYELGVGNELSAEVLAELQKKATETRDAVEAANLEVQEATTYRKRLEGIVAEMTAAETQAKKQLDDLQNNLTKLEKQLDEREDNLMKEFVELPIIDAFGRPIKIEQVWLPKLTINYNFRDVARFDRCTTCHQAIDKSAPGSAVAPGYRERHTVVVNMETPAKPPKELAEAEPDAKARQELYVRLLKETYGLQLAPEGVLDPDDAVISVVRPQSAAAKAQLEVGDVIEAVSDVKILGKPMVFNYLLESVTWGQPVAITVRRGMPHPFASHPRLDLFVGSLSPHKKDEIGCTICHDGQGSATAFKWASHTPENPEQAEQWKREYGWFDNHHWIYPMYPKRFSESLCLKCHHDVTELEPSQRFPDPPAPKLTQGFHLIEQFGCFGCHEINGFDGPNRRVGPDLRTEPAYASAAEALLAGGGLDKQQQEWAAELVKQPANDTARRALAESIKNGEKLPGDPNLTKKLLSLLDEIDTPGKLRKIGPSLRHVASKVDFEFLYSWIRKPSDFRPTTKMPQFFGLWDHLDKASLEQSHRLEPIEIRGATEYLLAKSQPFAFAARPKSVTVEPSPERGKLAFQVRCLACHQHDDFPGGKMTQGPDLSRIGAKLARASNPDGPKWLYSWLRNPSKYHARTLMPNMMLDPLPDADGKLTDPAADIAVFLLGSKGAWTPADVPARQLTESEDKALQELALEHLKTVFTRRQAEIYLKDGIPESRRSELKGDEVELVGEMNVEKKLQYVGRRTLAKYGCFGCHDIPGFEDSKPIGTGLADWARKTNDKLAFEQIVEYMKHGHGAPGALVHKIPEPENVSDKRIEEADEGPYGHTHMDFLDLPPDTGYFMEKLFEHQRVGFVWQKLREPRSYDYRKTANKGYNERLRMPKFTALDDQQREAIITFVMGLVAEPPAPQYIYRAPPRRNAIVQGLQVIEKFNCTGCHTIDLERWDLAYNPSDFPKPEAVSDYDFLQPHVTPQQRAAAETVDAAGRRHATITGMPVADANGEPLRHNEEGTPLGPDEKNAKGYLFVMPWENVLLNGEVWQAGLQKILVPESAIEKRYPPLGGFLARFVHPTVVAEEKKVNANVNPDEAWGWLPPPLAGEGRKVQTAWLHDFLLDPHVIRPATVLRMPKFNMSPAEATKLVNFFAAVDNVEYPYDFDPRTRETYLASEDAQHPGRLGDALKIVTQTECVKCHLVGDYTPKGSERNNAPQLAAVYRRLRPDFLLPWIANPKRLLPYTRMQANIPPDKPVDQALFKGTSKEQLNALVDLLLNYDRFMEKKTSIEPLVKVPPTEAAENSPPRPQRQGPAQ